MTNLSPFNFFLVVGTLSLTLFSSFEALATTPAAVIALKQKTWSPAAESFYAATYDSIERLKAFQPADLQRFRVPEGQALRMRFAQDIQKDKPALRRLQTVLETLAIDNAFLLSCDPHTRKKRKSPVSACRIELFSRSKKGRVAQVQKKFQVPVHDASSWGPIMMARLLNGLSQKERRAQKKQIESALSSSSKEDGSLSVLLRAGAGLVGSNTRTGFSSTPALSLGVSFGEKSRHTGAWARFEGINSENGTTGKNSLRGYAVGLQATAASEALSFLLWELGFQAAYHVRELRKGEASGDYQALSLGISPGVFYEVNNTAIGLSVGLHFVSPLEAKFRSEESAAERLDSSQLRSFEWAPLFTLSQTL